METVFDFASNFTGGSGNSGKFAVIGHPIGHTMSPFIHERLFSLSGIKTEYEAVDVEKIEDKIEWLRSLNGFNITIPHKRNIIPYLDEVDEKARIFGSVNTVANFGGKLKGFTTDGAGCRKALENHGTGLTGDLLLLGNGGAARAIAFESLDFMRSLTIAVRNPEKGEALKADLLSIAPSAKIVVTSLADCPEQKYDLMINTTSVGMYPKTEGCPAEDRLIRCCTAVFDAVYNPAETVLLKKAADCGCICIGGMEMLVYQAVAGHEHWYGGRFQAEDIRALCRDARQEMEEKFGGK